MSRLSSRAGALVAGRYRLEARLGSGAMGTVWLARDQLLSRTVALKQVLPAGSSSTGEARRALALREGRAAAALRHPHSVAVHDVVVEAGEPWLVMEHVPSRSLAELVREHGSLPGRLVAQVGAQVADALAAAHEAGVVHRDVKPGNVLVTVGGRAGGQVKLSDFGIARGRLDLHTGADPGADPDVFTGTPEFMAPEVARGGDPTWASDVYSLGATLFALVEGAPPSGLSAGDVPALLRRVASGEVPVPQQAGVARPALVRMLEPDPARRPTMAAARDELLAAAAGGRRPEAVLAAPFQVTVAQAPRAPEDAGAPEPAGSPGRPSRSVLLVAGAVLVVLVLLAVVLVVR